MPPLYPAASHPVHLAVTTPLSGSSNFNGIVPQTALLEVPLVFRDASHAYKVLDGKVGQSLLDELGKHGLKGLAYFENGWRALTNNKRPVVTPEGLDRDFLLQFATFVENAVRGDFGISYRNQQDVFALIVERLPATLELVLAATLLSLVVGIPLGVVCAIRRNSVLAQGLQFASVLGVPLPSFAVGILLILCFSVELKWLPAFGRGDVIDLGWRSTGLLTPAGQGAIILPAITLSLFQVTLVMRLVRDEMLEVLRADFIRFARSRGLKNRTIHFRHALRNCLMPVITIVGIQIGNLIAFALVTETVFQWPGMGFLFIQAVTFVDIPVMAAYLVVVSFIFVAMNALVDLLYAVVDPRLRGEVGRVAHA